MRARPSGALDTVSSAAYLALDGGCLPTVGAMSYANRIDSRGLAFDQSPDSAPRCECITESRVIFDRQLTQETPAYEVFCHNPAVTSCRRWNRGNGVQRRFTSKRY